MGRVRLSTYTTPSVRFSIREGLLAYEGGRITLLEPESLEHEAD